MLKFAIIRTKDDDEETLYISDTKEAAMKKGEEIANRSMRSEGLISLERIDVDEENHRISNRCELMHTWR